MKRLKSDIPPGAEERPVSAYKQQGAHIQYQIRECILDGRVVGRRAYTRDGRLVMETPLQDGQKHGREYTWSEDGTLLLVEPYVKGQIHGIARQYGAGGRLIGTYRLAHGTGLDVWRQESGSGRIFISEIHSLQNGLPHGYEWWFTERGSLWHERPWHAGQYHGIERMWNSRGKLRRGYSKYWVAGQAVNRRKYLKAVQTTGTLPPYRVGDNSPRRRFPPEIRQLLGIH